MSHTPTEVFEYLGEFSDDQPDKDPLTQDTPVISLKSRVLKTLVLGACGVLMFASGYAAMLFIVYKFSI